MFWSTPTINKKVTFHKSVNKQEPCRSGVVKPSKSFFDKKICYENVSNENVPDCTVSNIVVPICASLLSQLQSELHRKDFKSFFPKNLEINYISF